MNISLELAKFVANTQYEDLQEHDVEVAKRCILDTIGVILAANTLGEGCEAFVKIAKIEGGNKQSTILGHGEKAPVSTAAFVNGSMAHSIDFGESHDAGFVHSSSSTVPAALAIAEFLGDVNGKELIAAVVLGNDLICRLGLAMTTNWLEYGWYMPPILGAFGATAAAGKLLRLTEKQMLDAFSLALCQATCSAEITQNPQSTIRSVRDAFSAKTGVMSALLAREGVKGFKQPFDGNKGLFYSFARNHYDADILVTNLGERFEGTYVSFKPWPSCRGTHPYIECLLQIMKEHNLTADDIKEMKAVVSKVNQTLICEPLDGKRKPSDSINAKFSLPYVLATALVYGQVNLEHFHKEAITNPAVLAAARKFTYEVNHQLTLKETLHGYLELITKDNERFFAAVNKPYGHPTKPMSDEELTKKFKDCSKYSKKKISNAHLEQLIDWLYRLESVDRIQKITQFL